MSKTINQVRGALGEQLACTFLENCGYAILEKNFSIRGGELDIIAQKHIPPFGDTLCFIEVKTRTGEAGSAERATAEGGKLQRLFRPAKAYCTAKNIDIDQTPIQFEQVSVYLKGLDEPDIYHFIIPIET